MFSRSDNLLIFSLLILIPQDERDNPTEDTMPMENAPEEMEGTMVSYETDTKYFD